MNSRIDRQGDFATSAVISNRCNFVLPEREGIARPMSCRSIPISVFGRAKTLRHQQIYRALLLIARALGKGAARMTARPAPASAVFPFESRLVGVHLPASETGIQSRFAIESNIYRGKPAEQLSAAANRKANRKERRGMNVSKFFIMCPWKADG